MLDLAAIRESAKIERDYSDMKNRTNAFVPSGAEAIVFVRPDENGQRLDLVDIH